MGETWLKDDTDGTGVPRNQTAASLARASLTARDAPLAVRIGDVVIHDTRKWFGAADIRIDALFVHGHVNGDQTNAFYLPATLRFSGVRDGDRLPIGDTGLLLFHGWPTYFLDMFVMVSRDRKDTDDLAKLLSTGLNSAEVQGAVGAILALTVIAPQAALVTAALGGAAVLGDFAVKVLRQVTGDTVGMYRTSYLEKRDDFGIGRHPPQGAFRVNELSFAYQIDLDTKLQA